MIFFTTIIPSLNIRLVGALQFSHTSGFLHVVNGIMIETIVALRRKEPVECIENKFEKEVCNETGEDAGCY